MFRVFTDDSARTLYVSIDVNGGTLVLSRHDTTYKYTVAIVWRHGRRRTRTRR